MFKKILRQITQIVTEEEFNVCCGEISRAYEAGKISWNDYNLLFDVISMKQREIPELR